MFEFIKSHNSYIENLILDIKATFDVHLSYKVNLESSTNYNSSYLVSKNKVYSEGIEILHKIDKKTAIHKSADS